MHNKKHCNFFKMFFSGFFRANDLFAVYKDEELEKTVKNATGNRLSWYALSKPHVKKEDKEILEHYNLDYSSRIASYWTATGNYIYNAMNTFDEKKGSKL